MNAPSHSESLAQTSRAVTSEQAIAQSSRLSINISDSCLNVQISKAKLNEDSQLEVRINFRTLFAIAFYLLRIASLFI